MSDDQWNDDVAYVFSIHRTLMQILGIWPLQKKSMFQMIRWSLSTLLQWTPFIFLFMEFTGNYRSAGASIEAILFFTCITTMISKHFCATLNRKKLAKNINAAINDWCMARNDEETYKIMKQYAVTSKLSASFIIYSTFICLAIFVFSVILMNLKQIFLQNTNALNGSSLNTINENWIFLIPAGTLGSKVTGSQYMMLIILQNLQIIVVCLTQSVMDSLYISITLHLSGQLKVLQTKFKAFACKPDSEINYQKQLINLINRHCKLTKLNQNIEDTFNFIILFQLTIAIILLALIGLRTLLCLKTNDYIELAKSILTLNFVFMQALVYSYGGDFVQRESEGIFYAIFVASWYTLPVTLIKDLRFAMMRSSYPFHLTGGKFFYANRETIVYVLKTAASYVSVLRVALRD